MRYSTKIDLWLAVALALSALIPVSIAVYGFMSEGAASSTAWSALAIGILTAVVIAAVSLPTYYEVQPDKLVVRSGLLKWSVRLDEIISVAPTSNPLSSPAWSLDRLEVRSTHDGNERTILISPKEREAFLRELVLKARSLVPEGDSLRRR